MVYVTPPASRTRIWDGYGRQETRDESTKRSKKMKAVGGLSEALPGVEVL